MEKIVFGQSSTDKDRAHALRMLNETLENLRQKNAEIEAAEPPKPSTSQFT